MLCRPRIYQEMYQNDYILKHRALGHRPPSTVHPPSPLLPHFFFSKKNDFFLFLPRERHMIIQIIMPHIFMISLKGGGESIQSNPAITDPSLLKNHKIIVIFPILQHFFFIFAAQASYDYTNNRASYIHDINKRGGESKQSNPTITDPSLLENHKIIVISLIFQHSFFKFL